MFEKMSKIIDGKIIVNVTPHPLTFLSKSGETVVVPTSVPEGERTSPWVVNATAVEKPIGGDLVTTVFLPTPEGEAILDGIERWAEEQQYNVRIIGSIIAAQAYPGRILNVIPAPGFERVPPGKKRMTTEKFTVFK